MTTSKKHKAKKPPDTMRSVDDPMDDLDEYDSLPSRSFLPVHEASPGDGVEVFVDITDDTYIPTLPKDFDIPKLYEDPEFTLHTKAETKELILIFEDDDEPVVKLIPAGEKAERKLLLETPEYVPPSPYECDPKKLNTEQRMFLTRYMSTGTVTAALRKTHISLKKYRYWLDNSPVFSRALLDATDTLADRLESEALKQALTGNTKLLIKSLEALRPYKWGRSSTVNTFLNGKVDVEIKDWAQLARQAQTVDITPGTSTSTRTPSLDTRTPEIST